MNNNFVSEFGVLEILSWIENSHKKKHHSVLSFLTFFIFDDFKILILESAFAALLTEAGVLETQ